MDNFDNNMRRQVYMMPDVLRAQYHDLEPKTRKVLSTPEIFSVQEIILTGCGDSYAAALAVKYAFEFFTGLPVRVLPALELARYYPRERMGTAPFTPLVVAVSNSGAVSRMTEALLRATECGAATLAITANPASPMANASTKVLELDIPSLPDAPGVCTYTISALALHLLAIRMGEVKGRYTMDVAMAYRADIIKQADALEGMLPEMDNAILALAQQWKDFPAYDFSGAGIDYAAALYGYEKILEAVGRPALCCDCEEWHHLNFFLRDNAHTGTVVFANVHNPAQSRVREMVANLTKMRRPFVIFGDAGAFDGAQPQAIATPYTDTGFSMPMTHAAAPALLAGYLSALAGEEYGRGAKDAWALCQGGAAVRNSEIYTGTHEFTK